MDLGFRDATAFARSALQLLPVERKCLTGKLARRANAYVYIDYLGRLAVELTTVRAGFMCVYPEHVIADAVEPARKLKPKEKSNAKPNAKRPARWVLRGGKLVDLNDV